MGDGWDVLKVSVKAGVVDDAVSLSSPGVNQVSIAINGSGWLLSMTKGDVIEISTGAGDDLVTVGNLSGTDVNEVVVYLGEGNDTLDGALATKPIKAYGEAGDDWFIGGAGNDRFDGGAGIDWMDYSDTPYRVKVDLAYRAHEDGRGGRDDLFNFENVRGGDGDDWIWGTSGANVIEGGEGNDKLYGGGGGDLIFGEQGNDELYGEDGNDELYGGEGNDKLYGGKGDDVLFGGDDNDRLYGGDGDDVVLGEAGDDELYGEDGDDILLGGDGNDLLKGGDGDDVLLGEDGDDRLYGEDDDDILIGGQGIDTVDAGRDDDIVYWAEGDGDDAIDMDSGWDILRVITGDSADTVSITSPSWNKVQVAGLGWTLNVTRGDVIEIDTGGGDDTVTVGNLSKTDLNELIIYLGTGDDRLLAAASTVAIKAYGGAGNDWLLGGMLADELYGDAGDDHLLGGPGHDMLVGGSGADIPEH
jgi:Ca2+-binding RTX toxin-like protein